MRPIELTRVLESGKAKSVFVNPDHIVSFGANEIGSYLMLSAGGSYVICETPEQIIGRLADPRSTMRAEARDEIVTYRP